MSSAHVMAYAASTSVPGGSLAQTGDGQAPFDVAVLAAVQDGGPRHAGWLLAAAAVLAIHGGLYWWATSERPAPPAAGDALPAIEMDLSPIALEEAAASDAAQSIESVGPTETLTASPTENAEAKPVEAEAVAPDAVAAAPMTTETAEPPPDTVTEAAPAETAVAETEAVDPAAEAAAVAEVAAVPAPVEKPVPPETVEAKPAEPQPAKPVTRTTRRAPRETKVGRASTRNVDGSASATSRASVGEAETGTRAASAAAARDFGSRVRAAIERRKQWPLGASGGGIATVRFTLAQGGTVLAAAIVRSTGSSAFDAAALQAVRSARMPDIPPEMGLSRITISVPINFRH